MNKNMEFYKKWYETSDDFKQIIVFPELPQDIRAARSIQRIQRTPERERNYSSLDHIIELWNAGETIDVIFSKEKIRQYLNVDNQVLITKRGVWSCIMLLEVKLNIKVDRINIEYQCINEHKGKNEHDYGNIKKITGTISF